MLGRMHLQACLTGHIHQGLYRTSLEDTQSHCMLYSYLCVDTPVCSTCNKLTDLHFLQVWEILHDSA